MFCPNPGQNPTGQNPTHINENMDKTPLKQSLSVICGSLGYPLSNYMPYISRLIVPNLQFIVKIIDIVRYLWLRYSRWNNSWKPPSRLFILIYPHALDDFTIVKCLKILFVQITAAYFSLIYYCWVHVLLWYLPEWFWFIVKILE